MERVEFSQKYYERILSRFVEAGYRTVQMSEYKKNLAKYPDRTLLIRHDVDARFDRVPLFVESETKFGMTATYFIRVHADYNIFFCDNYEILRSLLKEKMEIGLHSNFVEFAGFFGDDERQLLKREKAVLDAVLGFSVAGYAPHRDINYLKNSLPLLEKLNLDEYGFKYQAYEPIFVTQNIEYINEGFHPHLGWRNKTPEQVAETGKNALLTLHPQWWHWRYPTGK